MVVWLFPSSGDLEVLKLMDNGLYPSADSSSIVLPVISNGNFDAEDTVALARRLGEGREPNG